MIPLRRHLTYPWTIVSLLILSICSPTLALEPLAVTPHIEILTPGIRKTIVVTQENNFPQDFGQFIVFLVGAGPVSITLTKHTPVGDLVRLTGLGISSAGIRPFVKFGSAAITFNLGIQIGDGRAPYGLLIFSTWIDEPSGAIDDDTGENSNTYTVTLAF